MARLQWPVAACINPSHHSTPSAQQQQPVAQVQNRYTKFCQEIPSRVQKNVWHKRHINFMFWLCISGTRWLLHSPLRTVLLSAEPHKVRFAAAYAVHLISIMYATGPSKAAMLIPMKGQRSSDRLISTKIL